MLQTQDVEVQGEEGWQNFGAHVQEKIKSQEVDVSIEENGFI